MSSPNSTDDFDYGALVDSLPSSTPSALVAVPLNAPSSKLLVSGKFEHTAPSPVLFDSQLPVTTAISRGVENFR